MGRFNANDPLGLFLTWTTYGTWLPGDKRGYIDWHDGWQQPNKVLMEFSKAIMTQDSVYLSHPQRECVEQTVRRHCEIRKWSLWEVNARTTHVHVVLTADGYAPPKVRSQLKAWCSAALNNLSPPAHAHWWAEGGSCQPLNDETSLERAILYTRDAQDYHTNTES